ncbi:MAG: tetratricopeptide repeat protein [bacterium]
MKKLIILNCFLLLMITGILFPQEFNVKKISEKVFIVSNPDMGDQITIQSAKGLVVFNSFWSEMTAKLFKEEIIRVTGRNDFKYVINMADRLDMIGGNFAYPEAIVVGHENIRTRYCSEKLIKDEIDDLVKMWREKEGYSQNRLQNFIAGSEEAKNEENWMNKCKTMAYELENSFSLIYPEIYFNDRFTIDLGNMNIYLYWFGNVGDNKALLMAVLPEEKLAILSKAIIYPRYHLAPNPFPYYGDLDVPRWIDMLELSFESNAHVDSVLLSDSREVFSRDLMLSHLNYIKKLWESVKSLEENGKTIQEIQDQLSLDKDFAFVKEMPVYKNRGDQWLRPQHEMHVKLFYLQGKNQASEIIKTGGADYVQTSLSRIRDLGKGVYIDETSIDFIGFNWMNTGKISGAIEVFKFNVSTFPDSFNAYNSLGMAYVKNGDNEKAKKSFNKSLELNPTDNYASELLKELETK